MARRQVVCLFGAASVKTRLAAALVGLAFSLTPKASAVGPGVLFEAADHARMAQTAQTPQTLSVPADSPRWNLEGQARAAEYQGRKCLFLDGGAATLKDFEMRDVVVDVDVATPASRGFFGIQFRIAGDGVNAEWIYLRQHKSGLP